MAIVLAFLMGMPLVAVPQISEQILGYLLANPPQQFARSRLNPNQPDQAAAEAFTVERGTTVTMLASDRSQAPLTTSTSVSEPNPAGLAATIEELKAQFVEAGVSYMVLERTGTDSSQYRFRFDMPVAMGSAYRKRFQVVNESPDEAMRQALTELQQWRVAGREPAQLERPTVILR